MSSSGPRAKGTDGGDYLHRERVANHYKASSTNKFRLKCVSILHLAMIVLMICRLSVSICVMFGLRPPSMLQRMRFPKAMWWEYAWLVSGVASIFGMMSLPRNKIVLMKQYLLGIFTFGLLPVFCGIYSLSGDLLDYWETRETNKLFLGFPVAVLWNFFLCVCLQLHGFGIYFGYQLIKAWTPASKKNR